MRISYELSFNSNDMDKQLCYHAVFYFKWTFLCLKTHKPITVAIIVMKLII